MSDAPFYALTAQTLQGQPFSFDQLQGKVVLVVNTASKCGLTPQYEGLEALYRKFKDRGLVILGFPCNQFANQEPGTEKSISEGCLINYGVSFPMMAKVDVNGPHTHPVYQYLKSQKKGILGGRIVWNFAKFLVNREGQVVRRYFPTALPSSMEAEIARLVG
jgi:glutathione peroxidase